jgi:rhamnose utilization protein RhaD (predicted bifunctional aldolase and dehydrogenase)
MFWEKGKRSYAESLELAGVGRRCRLGQSHLEQQLSLASNHPDSSTPVINALLHAVIPANTQNKSAQTRFWTNAPRAAELIRSVFGPTELFIPYFHSDFKLAKAAAAALTNSAERKTGWRF